MSQIELGDNVTLEENSDGEPVLRHTPSGATLVYDSDKGAWTVGSFAADSVETDNIDSNSQPASYHVYSDGTTVWARPQRSGLDAVSEPSIGTLLEDLIKNQLPPTGTDDEANGKILLAGHDEKYPGKLSDYSTEEGVVGAAGLKIEGEGTQNPTGVTAVGQTNNTENLVTLQTDNAGFVAPDSGDDINHRFACRHLAIEGPGVGSNGSIAFSNPSDHDQWDWVFLEDLSVFNFDAAHDFTGAHLVNMRECYFEGFREAIGLGADAVSRFYADRCAWVSGTMGSGIRFTNPTSSATPQGASVTNSILSLSPDSGSGAARPYVAGFGNCEWVHFNHNTLEIIDSGASGASRGVQFGPDTQSYECIGNTMRGVGDVTDAVYRDATQQAGGKMIGNHDRTTSPNSLDLENGSEQHIVGNHFPNGIVLSSPTRPRFNGTVYIGSSPTGSNYDSGDAGVTIIDRSTSPADMYKVDTDGTLLGPF
jgi:hypothetical protein